MAIFISRAVFSAAFGLMALPLPAHAQFGQIFGGPPRPPSDVQRQQAPAPMGVPREMPPEEMDDEDQPPPPPQRPALPPARAQQQRAPQQQAAPQQAPQQQQQQGGFSSQPLAPPTGLAPQQQAPQQQATPGLAPGQTIPPVQQAAPAPGQPAQGQRAPQTAARGTPAPTSAAPQPGDEVVVELPAQKIANPTAVFAGLDKVTGRITTFEVQLNETVQFGALQVTPRVCYTRPPTETANTDTFAEVNEVTLQGEVKRIFAGWMFASSPGLHAVEHPIYDVWLTDCKGGTLPVADATPAPAPARTQTRAPAAAPVRNPAQNPAPSQQRAPVQQPTLQQPPPVGPPPGFR